MRALLAALVLLAPGLLAEERSAADPRAQLAFLEQALSQAADRVARPSVFAITGAECRGYRIEGQGAVFVLPPRAVRSRNVVVWRLPEARAPRAPRDRRIRVVELQAEELQREAARTHAELERAIAEVEREVERRLATEARGSGAAVPAAPAATAPAAAPLPPVAPEAPAAPLPPSPPWALWFEAGGGPEQEAPAEAVVGRMRAALVEALAEHGFQLRGLRPDESIAVAVDFVPSFPFGASRPERTLVLRVRMRDLDERRAGKLAVDQLKTRIEAVEY